MSLRLDTPCHVVVLNVATSNIFFPGFSSAVLQREVRAAWDTSPHVAPLPVPALVALIRRGVPGRSLWRHRLTALLALLQPGPALHTSIPSNLSPAWTAQGAWREVGHWRWSRMSQSPAWPRPLHLSSAKPLSIRAGCFLFLLFPLPVFSSLPVVVVLLPHLPCTPKQHQCAE